MNTYQTIWNMNSIQDAYEPQQYREQYSDPRSTKSEQGSNVTERVRVDSVPISAGTLAI
jgi:hypothetical protein